MKPSAAAGKSKKKLHNVPYTRVKGVQTKFRKERACYGVSVQSLTTMTSTRLLQKLTQDGLLRKWTGATCPHCPLTYFKQKKVWTHRCSKKGCQKRVQPHVFHRIFFSETKQQSFFVIYLEYLSQQCRFCWIWMTSQSFESMPTCPKDQVRQFPA